MSHKKFMIFPVVGCALLLTSCGTPSPEAEDSTASLPAELASPPEGADETLPREPTNPPAPPADCPYYEEVAEVPDDEQFDLAVELGCEYDIYGEIQFEGPIRILDDDAVMVGLIDPDRAMTEEEMEEAGYL
ncbi:hypothetical protein [Nesterenkonia halotolerans]|uniref:DUF3558 domain-containing protein n=1 Tax=Nesterenkonia halotolerans TaxID=225325 RepID=A0ABR9J3Z2_9MICC|nr:hypothetical protein [Nesterenkonia halotolerans]MBE1513720.1 hypothetical protein [Nesterenkonia halotolerans]